MALVPLLVLLATWSPTSATAATALAPAVQDRAESPAADDLSRPKRRLLFLAGGGVVRATAHLAGDVWAIDQDRRSFELPAASVERVLLEADVLAEARERAGALRSGDLEPRVEHARWLASNGLAEESLRALDRVLEDDADHAAALAFLAERPVDLALPPLAEREDFFTRAARLPPAARELALHELRALEPEPLLAELERELVARSSQRRELAALALRRFFPGAAALPLARRAVLDPAADVRAEASRALRDARAPEVALPVISALGSSHTLARRHAADALGAMGYPLAVEPLVKTLQSTTGYRPAGANIFVGRQIAYVGDFDVEVAQSEGIADPQINVLTEGSVLEGRVMGASASDISAERSAVRGALEHLTGAKVSNLQTAWQRWWDEHGQAFQREHGLVPPPSEQPTTGAR